VLDDKISEYVDIISKAAMKAGPQVMQFAIQNQRWCGVQDLAVGCFFLLIAVVCAFLFHRHAKHVKDCEEPGLSLAVGSGIVGIITLILSACSLLNIWNWVAVFNPKIALFHDILTKFLSK
jgi:Co/Zn/Cd efflux system component